MNELELLNFGSGYTGDASQFFDDVPPTPPGSVPANAAGTFSGVAGSVLDLIKTGAGLQAQYWGVQDARANAQLQRDTSRMITSTNASIEQINAQARLAAAQRAAQPSLSFAQLQAQLAAMTKGNNWQIYLAAAALALAWLQYRGKK